MSENAARHGSARPLRVMLVDDSEMQIQYQKELLGDQQMEFIVAYSGEQALALCEAELPDVMLLDVEMPGMSGLEVTQILRSNARTATIPIIMVSAKTGDEVIEEAFVDGCSEYVVKPIHKADMLAKIQGLTGVPLLEGAG